MLLITKSTRLLALLALRWGLLAGAVQTSRAAADQADTSRTVIEVAFKLDPSITRGMYMGDRWVSPPTYTGVKSGQEMTVEARATGRDAKGRPIAINPRWIPEDPEMVAVSPGQGKEVKITVRRAGQSSLEVAAAGLSKKLTIKARYQGNSMYVDISQ